VLASVVRASATLGRFLAAFGVAASAGSAAPARSIASVAATGVPAGGPGSQQVALLLSTLHGTVWDVSRLSDV